jgi:outer membrane receptor protein involved in Fe transport
MARPHLAASLALFILSLPALFAQPAPTLLEPVTVTAQQRSQAIGDVPVPITAFTGTTLQALGLTRYEDLAPLVPGLFLSVQSPATPSINLRGVGSDSTDPRHESRISVFQDGVAISRAAGSVTELFDLERVEVLKGPQGTLFGRNAGAGAIALISRRPTGAREASLTLGGGDPDRLAAAGVLNTPLGSDRLLARLAFTSEHRAGYVPNLADGSTLNSRESSAVRGALRWLPAPDTTVDLILNFQRDTPAGTAFKSGVIPTSAGDTNPFTAAELNRGAALGLDRTVWGATVIATHPLSAAWTLTSTTAGRAFDSHEEFDGDGSRLYLFEANDDNHGRTFSQELRLNFDSHARWTGFVGLSAALERAAQDVDIRTDERVAWPFLSGRFRDGLLAAGVPPALAATAVPALNPFAPSATLPAGFAALALVPPLAPLAALAGAPLKPLHSDHSVNTARFDGTDVFADGTWRVTDRLELTAGARLAFERQVAGYDSRPSAVPSTLGFLLNAGPNFAYAPTAGRLTESARTTGWAGCLHARYLLRPGLSAYASLARGRRPATILITSTDRTRNAEETIVNTELGLKGRTADGHFDGSASLFRYRYAHFQTFVQDPANLARFIPVDAGRATGLGGELALRAALGAGFSAFTTYGYTDATFDARAANGTAQQFAGSTFRLTARHTAALGVTWAHRTPGRGHFAFSPRWEYKSAHYFDDDNTTAGGTLRQPGFALVHLRATWSTADRTWEATLSAANLFDHNFLVDAGNIGASFGIPTFVRGAPRQLALDVTRRF